MKQLSELSNIELVDVVNQYNKQKEYLEKEVFKRTLLGDFGFKTLEDLFYKDDKLIGDIFKFNLNNTIDYSIILNKKQYTELLDGGGMSKLYRLSKIMESDYVLLKNTKRATFIHLTKEENVERILNNGINMSDNDNLSFGSGVYCYEMDNRTEEFLNKLKSSMVGIVFTFDIYYKCVADMVNEVADGSGAYPPYIFINSRIDKSKIIEVIRFQDNDKSGVKSF